MTKARKPLASRDTRIAFVGLSGGGLDAQVLRGVNIFRHAGRPWIMEDMGHSRQGLHRLLEAPEFYRGVLANVTDSQLSKQLQQTALPVVDLSGFVQDSPFVFIGTDNRQVGSCGAEYFLQRHYKHFLFVSNSRSPYEVSRWQGFSQRLEQSGFQPAWLTFEKGLLLDPHRDIDTDGIFDLKFLKIWPGSVAVMAASDRAGAKVCDLCRSDSLRVPEQVAVLGVDNAEFICDSALPPLSSVALAAEKIGYEAGRVLSDLMEGRKPDRTRILFDPVEVVTRQSTDITAIDDVPIARALGLMREHAAEKLSIPDIAQAVGLGRRTFYRRFEKAIGRTPLEELYRMRVDQAKHLLSATALSVYNIALDCGFGDTDTLNRRFKEFEGTTPSAYRRRYAIE